MEIEKVEKEYKHEIMEHPELYPELMKLEIRKNRYKMYGHI